MSHDAVLRKVGGSVMLAIPPALLGVAELSPGQTVEVSVEERRIVIQARRRRPSYSLSELLARCDPDAPVAEEDREWLNAPRSGKELL